MNRNRDNCWSVGYDSLHAGMRRALFAGCRFIGTLLSWYSIPVRAINVHLTARTLIAVMAVLMIWVLGGFGDSVQVQASNQRAVRIDVKFTGNFVQDALASGETLPSDTTFGSVAFATHESTVSYFKAGETASAGLKAFAETGATATLVEEFDAQTNEANVYPKGSQGTFPQDATAEQTFEFHRASSGQSQLTFVASFSESPDWFVGARNIDLRPGGVWIEELEVDLFAWDAGTDSGTDWDSADSATDPVGNVTSLKGMGKFSDTPIGKLTITMLVPPSNSDKSRVTELDTGSLDNALNVFWRVGDTLKASVDFDRYLVAWKSGAEEFQTDLNGDRVKVVMGKNQSQTTIDGLTNGTEYTVRVTHANAIGPAGHSSEEVTATPLERVRELVSNFAQNPGWGGREPMNVRSGRDGEKFVANYFTTGATAERLGSVTFLRVIPRKAGEENPDLTNPATEMPRNLVIELQLTEDDGGTPPYIEPSTVIGTFVSPAEYVDGPATFVAPGDGFALSPSTRYWLKLVLISGEVEIVKSPSRDEDPTGESGWWLGYPCFAATSDFPGQYSECRTGALLMSLNKPIDSALPLASINGGSAVEGQSVEFTVELSRAPGAQATVQYDTIDSSGFLPAKAADNDYTAVTSGTITFAANETSKTISIATGDDSTDENDERFLVRLSSPSANIALSERDTAAGMIINNDQTTSGNSTVAGLTLTDGDGNPIALNETFDPRQFVYTADAGSVDRVTVTLTPHSGVTPHYLRWFNEIRRVKEGNAAAASDAEFIVAPGLNLLRVLITSNNRKQESLYQVLVTKTASSDATIMEITLEDGDYADMVLTPTFDPSVTEYTATVTTATDNYFAIIPNHAGADVRVTLNDTALDASKSSFGVTTFDVSSFDLFAGANTLEFEVTAEDGTTKTYRFTLTLIASVKFGAGPFSVDEGSSVSVPVILDRSPAATMTIPLTVTNQSGASAADYIVPSSVAFAVGETQKSVVLMATADDVTDTGESVQLGFGTLPNGISSVNPKNATINIQDVAAGTKTVNFEQASHTVAEGNSAEVKLTLDSAAAANVDFPVTATNQGGATSADYTSLPSSISIASGADEGSFTFIAVDDSNYDPGESVKLSLGMLPTGYNAGATSETTINISNNDAVPQVAVSFGSNAYSVDEGGSRAIIINLSADPERTVSIPLRLTNQGGASSGDYSSLPSNATFNSGETTKAVNFSATQDSVDDDSESVKLSFTNLPGGVTPGTPGETVISIIDDDYPEVTVGFQRATYTIPESGNEDIRVVLDKDPERQFEIAITVMPNDADPADFEFDWPDDANPGKLMFSAGVREQVFTFQSLSDVEEDDGETVTFSIDTQSADRVSLGAKFEATVTIKPQLPTTTRESGNGGGGGGGGGGSSNRPPTVDGPRNIQYPEHGTEPVATYTATDPEGTEISWELEDTDAEHLRISGEGVLTFIKSPDYENPIDFRLNNTYEIRILAVDSGIPRASGRLQVRIEIKQVNEIGPITGEAELSVEENFTGVLGQYSAEDPEGDAIGWSLSGPDAAFFGIDEDGNLSLNTALDFEAQCSAAGTNDFAVTVVTTDDNRRPVSRELPVVVTVTDIVDEPVNAELSTESLILLMKFDSNGDGTIDMEEAIQVANGYFKGEIARDFAIAAIALYFESPIPGRNEQSSNEGGSF